MRAATLCGVIIAVMLACAAPSQPTTPFSTIRPTVTASPVASGTPSAVPSTIGGATPTPSATPTAGPPAGLSFTVFAGGFRDLTFVTNAGDGSNRLFVVEQLGRIRIIAPDHSVAAAPFLDISDRITSSGERGLLGLAFHPQYAQNGRFYVDYTDSHGNTVVSEFVRQTDDAANPASERVIFTVDQPFPNHNGGMVAFGPDGKLYVGMGDGGSGGDPLGNGQDPDTLLGKIVRVDVDAAPGPAAQPQIWDMGLRNPWRFSFDRQTGDLWIGDVGQGLHEEIDAEAAGTGGLNYGWNIMEGAACYNASTCDQAGLTLPVTTYDHLGGACSVTGGYVYRGSANPDLIGTYLFADYCSAGVWGLDAGAVMAGARPSRQVLGNSGGNPSSFGEDEAGELYLVDHGGRILALTYRASPQQ